MHYLFTIITLPVVPCMSLHWHVSSFKMKPFFFQNMSCSEKMADTLFLFSVSFLLLFMVYLHKSHGILIGYY